MPVPLRCLVVERATGTAHDREAAGGWWRHFAEHECRGYSPLYEAICHAVADAPDVLDLVLAAPSSGRRPNVLLAAAHDLVLRGVDHPLRPLYERAERHEAVDVAEAAGAFVDLVRRERSEVERLLSFRRTNTNECGRSAVLVPALRWATTEVGEPLALVDVGTSAGLNLRLDRYRIDYGNGRSTGPADSPVVITCTSTGPAPVEAMAPAIVARIGLDREPVDLDDPAEVRWLLACVWPDTGRLARTRAAIDLARREPVEVVAGDAVDDLARTVDRLPDDVPLAVTTSWVLAYLRPEARDHFVEQLAALSHDRAVVWISAEGPGVVPDVKAPPATDDLGAPSVTLSVLAATVFRDGTRERTTALGLCHPHGSSLAWTATHADSGGASS